jgi:hypothetical protein
MIDEFRCVSLFNLNHFTVLFGKIIEKDGKFYTKKLEKFLIIMLFLNQ